MLCEQGRYKLARCGAVCVKVHILLCAVENLQIDCLAVWRPSEVCKVTLAIKVTHLQVDNLSVLEVVNTHAHTLRRHTVHRILNLEQSARAGCYIEQREARNIALVLLVEGKQSIVGRREESTRDTELVARNRTADNDIFVCVSGYGALLAILHYADNVVLDGLELRLCLCGCLGTLLAARTNIYGNPTVLSLVQVVVGVAFTPNYRVVVGYQLAAQYSLLHSEQTTIFGCCSNGNGCKYKGQKFTHQNRYFSVFTWLIYLSISSQASSERVVPTTSITFPAVTAPIVPHWRRSRPSVSPYINPAA